MSVPSVPDGWVPVAAVAAGFCLVVGGLLLFDGARRLAFRRRALEAFERTDAVVAYAGVREAPGSPGRVHLDLEYEYEVGGETHESTNVWPTRGADGAVAPEVAERVAADHPSGSTVVAHYDPEDPSSAYLLGDATVRPQLAEAAAGVLLLAGFVVLVVALL